MRFPHFYIQRNQGSQKLRTLRTIIQSVAGGFNSRPKAFTVVDSLSASGMQILSPVFFGGTGLSHLMLVGADWVGDLISTSFCIVLGSKSYNHLSACLTLCDLILALMIPALLGWESFLALSYLLILPGIKVLLLGGTWGA